MKGTRARLPDAKSREFLPPHQQLEEAVKGSFLPSLPQKMTAGMPAHLSPPALPSAWIRRRAASSWTWGEWRRGPDLKALGRVSTWVAWSHSSLPSPQGHLTPSIHEQEPEGEGQQSPVHGQQVRRTHSPSATASAFDSLWASCPSLGAHTHAGCSLHRESVEGSSRSGGSPFLPFSWFTDSGKASASSGSTTSPGCSPKHEGFSPKKSASQVSPWPSGPQTGPQTQVT